MFSCRASSPDRSRSRSGNRRSRPAPPLPAARAVSALQAARVLPRPPQPPAPFCRLLYCSLDAGEDAYARYGTLRVLWPCGHHVHAPCVRAWEQRGGGARRAEMPCGCVPVEEGWWWVYRLVLGRGWNRWA